MLKTIKKGDSGNVVKAAQYMFNQAARAMSGVDKTVTQQNYDFRGICHGQVS